MTIEQARAVVADRTASFAEQVEAVAAMSQSPDVEIGELIRCLHLGGYAAELASIALYDRTGRPRPNSCFGFALDPAEWTDYLQRQIVVARAS